MLFFLAVSALVATMTTSVPPPPPMAAECARARVLASQPPGAFFENLIVNADGSVLFTSYMDGTIRRYDPSGGAVVFASLPAHPVSLARRGVDLWVVAHGASFADGSAFMATNQLLRLDAEGSVVETIPIPQARFLNGMADMPDGDLLIADSISGIIWRFSIATRTVTVWLQDPLLAPAPKQAVFLPGANGIEKVSDSLLISNTSRGMMLRARLNADGNAEGLVVLSSPGPIDDFYVEASGDIIAATHANTIVRITPAGELSVILPSGANGATSVAPIPGRNGAYVLTTGNAAGETPGPATLLEITLPGSPVMCSDQEPSS